MATVHTQTIHDAKKVEVEPDEGDVRIRITRHDGTAFAILAKSRAAHAFDFREQTIYSNPVEVQR